MSEHKSSYVYASLVGTAQPRNTNRDVSHKSSATYRMITGETAPNIVSYTADKFSWFIWLAEHGRSALVGLVSLVILMQD